MVRTYFDGWFSGTHARAIDWFDGLVYVEIKRYTRSTAVDRPDEEKDFVIRFDDPDRIRNYASSIVAGLERLEEHRDASGRPVPLSIELPKIDFFSRLSCASAR